MGSTPTREVLMQNIENLETILDIKTDIIQKEKEKLDTK